MSNIFFMNTQILSRICNFGVTTFVDSASAVEGLNFITFHRGDPPLR